MKIKGKNGYELMETVNERRERKGNQVKGKIRESVMVETERRKKMKQQGGNKPWSWAAWSWILASLSHFHSFLALFA